MAQTTLMVGCGGSGITTLLRFNEMLAGNPEWRDILWERVAYLIVDTEVSKSETFKEAIDLQMGAAKKPIIRLAQITKGYHHLNDIVQPNFDNKNDETHALLNPHWWHDTGGMPFRAGHVRDLEKGAGQCGPVSYLCTWNFLPQLEKDVRDILDDIKSHNIGESNPLENINVFVVAGLAGGTGRGSWNLIAFKIKQYLKVLGHTVEPTGVFFDATCFPNVVKADPQQDTNTKVNSITAISELSAWMRLRDGHETYEYHLPNLAKPDKTGHTDVIHVSAKADDADPYRMSPLTSAHLIFGDNGRAALGNNEQYHYMTAAGLYGLVAGSEFVAPRTINRLNGFGSFAASTFEVDTIRLQAYFESFIREATVRELYSEAIQGGELEQEAQSFLGTGAEIEGENTFFGKTRFFVPVEEDLCTQIKKEDNGNILRHVITKILNSTLPNGDAFENTLKEQKEDDAWEYVTENLLLPILTEEKKKQILEEVLAQYKIPDVKTTVLEEIKKIYIGGRGHKPSIGRALAAVRFMRDSFAKSVKSIERPISIEAEVYEKEQDVLEKFQPLFDKAKKKKLLEFKPFTNAEIITLKTDFEEHLNYAAFFKIRVLLIQKFEEAKMALIDIEAALNSLTSVLKETEKEFRKDADKDAGAEKGHDAYETLFVEENTEAVFKSLPRADAPTNVYRRVLQPILSREKMEEMLLGDDARYLNADKINHAIGGELDKLLAGTGVISTDDKGVLKKTFKALFKSNVFLGKKFIEKHYSLEGVLKGNLPHWNKLLEERFGNADDFDSVCDRLRVFLGVNDRELKNVEDGEVPKIKWDGLIRNIVVSLVGTCKPWVRFTGDNGEYLETVVLLPIALDENSERQELKEAIDAKHKTQRDGIQIFHRGMLADGGRKLPTDRIVVFASQNIKEADNAAHLLDTVTSLNYWKEAKVNERLQLAEAGDGSAFFDKNDAKTGYIERTRGLGYISPIFVNDLALRELRWKPWAPKETVSQKQARENEVITALLYAFTGQGLENDDPLVQQFQSRFGWNIPLVEMGRDKSEDFSFTREPLEWKNGKGAPSVTPAWAPDDKLTTSIDYVFKFLLGEGGKAGLDGKALVEDQNRGREQLKQLSSEVAAFQKNIKPVIGGDAYKRLAEARNKWLVERSRKASGEDKEYWKKLQEAAKKETIES